MSLANKMPVISETTPNKKILNDFTAQDTKRDWTVYIDGKVTPIKNRLSIESKEFGRFEYAMSSLGHDAIVYTYAGKGGVVIVPYCIIDGELFVGFVEQLRPNQADAYGNTKVLNLPQGYVDPGEQFITASERESDEELELNWKSNNLKFKRLCRPLNQDDGLVATIPSGKVGIEIFSLKIHRDLLKQYRKNVYVLATQINNKKLSPSQLHENILGAYFYHWTKVFDITDMFSLCGVLLLRTSLEQPRAV